MVDHGMLQPVGHLHRRFVNLENVSELLVEQAVVFHPCEEVEVRNHEDSQNQKGSVLPNRHLLEKQSYKHVEECCHARACTK
jgi:hypothetical protein